MMILITPIKNNNINLQDILKLNIPNNKKSRDIINSLYICSTEERSNLLYSVLLFILDNQHNSIIIELSSYITKILKSDTTNFIILLEEFIPIYNKYIVNNYVKYFNDLNKLLFVYNKNNNIKKDLLEMIKYGYNNHMLEFIDFILVNNLYSPNNEITKYIFDLLYKAYLYDKYNIIYLLLIHIRIKFIDCNNIQLQKYIYYNVTIDDIRFCLRTSNFDKINEIIYSICSKINYKTDDASIFDILIKLLSIDTNTIKILEINFNK